VPSSRQIAPMPINPQKINAGNSRSPIHISYREHQKTPLTDIYGRHKPAWRLEFETAEVRRRSIPRRGDYGQVSGWVQQRRAAHHVGGSSLESSRELYVSRIVLLSCTPFHTLPANQRILCLSCSGSPKTQAQHHLESPVRPASGSVACCLRRLSSSPGLRVIASSDAVPTHACGCRC
jgi:hypothetical protein